LLTTQNLQLAESSHISLRLTESFNVPGSALRKAHLFEHIVLQHRFGKPLFEVAILFLEISYLSAVGLAFSIAHHALSTSLPHYLTTYFQKTLRPAVALTGGYAFSAVQFSDRLFFTLPFEHNVNLLLRFVFLTGLRRMALTGVSGVSDLSDSFTYH